MPILMQTKETHQWTELFHLIIFRIQLYTVIHFPQGNLLLLSSIQILEMMEVHQIQCYTWTG